NPPQCKTPGHCRGSCVPWARGPTQRSALAELLAATGLVEADLLTFHFAGIAGDEAGLLQCGLERFVGVDERAGDAVTHCACLTTFTATVDVDVEVEAFHVVGQHEGLAHDHAAGFTSEVLVDGLAVDDDLARTLFQEHAGHRSLAAAGAIVPITDHDLSLDFQRFGLLSGVRMLGASIDLELLGHGVTQRTLGQHALDGLLERTTGKTLLHFLEVRFSDTARIPRVTVVLLVLRLRTGHDDIGGVDHDDIVARVNVRRKFWLVLSTQTVCDFAGHTPEDFALSVDHVPVTLDFMRLGHKGLHDGS